MGLFSSVGRRPSNRSRVSKPEIDEKQSQQLFAPTPQQQQFLLVPPMRRMQTITRSKSNQDYSQAIKLVNINELDEIIKRVNLNNDDLNDSHLKQHEEDGNNFRRSDWPPGAIPSNPLSSNPSNPQSQLSQNAVPGFQRGRTLMMRTAVSDINVNSDFKETLMNLRQLAGVKKKFSSIDSDYGQGPIFSQERINSLAVASTQRRIEPSKKKSSLPLRVDMPHNDFDEINSQLNLEEASLKDSKPVSLHQTTPNLTKIEENARLENSTIQEEKRNAALPLNSQESADIHSLDSAMVRNTNVVLTPNYEHTMREGVSNPDLQDSQDKEQNSSEKLAQNVISADVKIKKDIEVLNFKNTKAKKQIRGQYFQNGIRGGFYATDKHIVYQKGANPSSVQKNHILTMKGQNAVQIIAQDSGLNQVSQYLSTSNPLLNFGNMSTQNFGYPLTSRQNERASNLNSDSSQVQFKVLKQIQGVDASKFREEEKARLQLKFQEKKHTREREMRLNFITSSRSEQRNKNASSSGGAQSSGQQVLESPHTAKTQNLKSERDGIHNAELILIEEEREEKASAENSQKELNKSGKQQILMSEESESIEGERIQLDQFFKLDPSKRRQSVAHFEDLNQMKAQFQQHIEPFEDEEYFQYAADYESALQNLKYIKSSSAIKQSPFNAGENDKASLNEDFSTKVLKQSSLVEQDQRVKLKRPGEIITSKEAIKQGDLLLSAERVKSPKTSDVASKRSSFFKAKAQSQVQQQSIKQQKETVLISIEPSSPQKVNIDIDKVIGQANPSNISLENYSQDLKQEQQATMKSEVTLKPKALKTLNREKNDIVNQHSFELHQDQNHGANSNKEIKRSLERASSRNSRNTNFQNENKEAEEKLLSLQQRSSSSIDKQYQALRVRQFDSLNDKGGLVSGRQVMTSHNSRRTSLQSSTFRLVSPKLNKNISQQSKGGDNQEEKIGMPQFQRQGNRQSPADSQTEDIQKDKTLPTSRKVPQIKFTNIRDAMYSSQSGRETVRSTNDINSRRSVSQQARRRISSQATRSLCKKFFENSQSNNEEGFYDYEINFPLNTERNVKSQGLKTHQDSQNRLMNFQSGKPQSKISKVEQGLQSYQAWGFNTDRIIFRPNTESGHQRQRFINLKSSQSSRHHNVLTKMNQQVRNEYSTQLKPQTAIETSQRVKISNLLSQADPQSALSAMSSQKNFKIQLQSQSEMSDDKLRHERIKFTSNISTTRKNKHFEYYASILGDPLNREASQFNLQEPISGINPLHVYLMGERLGIITKNFAFKHKKSQTLSISESQKSIQSPFRKDFPELLWIAQQALIIKTPPESIPSTFFVNSYDVYQSLSTLNFGLHPGDQYFRQLFETIVSNKEYQENDSRKIASCSWLFFVDKSAVDSQQQQNKEKGYYFNMATQSKRLGVQNQPQALLKVSRKDMLDENDTVSQQKFKRILTTQQSITRRESLLTARHSSNNLADVINLKTKDKGLVEVNQEVMKGSQTSRTQTAQYQSVLMNLKSKYLSNIQSKKAIITSPKQKAPQNQIPNSPTKSDNTLKSPTSPHYKEQSNQDGVSQKSGHQRRVSLSRRKLSQRQMATTSQKPLFPLGSNDFLIQRRLSLEFTMKNKQEQQQKRKDEIINLMVKNSTHSKQQTLESQSSMTKGQVKFFDEQSEKPDMIIKEKIEEAKPIIKILRLPQPKATAYNKTAVLLPTPYQRNLKLKEQLSQQNLALKSITQHPEVALIPNLKIEEMNLIEKKFDSKKDQAKIFSDNLRKTVAIIRGQTYQSNQYTSRGANSQLNRFNRGVTGKNSSDGNENIHDFYDGFEDPPQETDTFLQTARPQLQQRLMMNQDVNEVLTNQGDPLGVSHLNNQNREGENLSSKIQLEADYFNLDDQELIKSLQQYQYASHQSQKSQQIPRSTVLINKADGIQPSGQLKLGMRRQSTLKQSPNHHISKFMTSPSRDPSAPDRSVMDDHVQSNRRQLLSKKSRSSQIIVDVRGSNQADGFGITMRKTSKISDFQCQTPNYQEEDDNQDEVEEEQDFQDYDDIE